LDGSYENGNEPSGSLKCWEVAQLAASQEGLSSISDGCIRTSGYAFNIKMITSKTNDECNRKLSIM
jgi:hypothetical protein